MGLAEHRRGLRDRRRAQESSAFTFAQKLFFKGLLEGALKG